MKHFQKESNCGNYEQRHKEFSSDGTVNNKFIKFQADVTSSTLIEIQQHAGI